MTTEQDDWDRGLREIPPKKVDRSTWPTGVRGLSIDEMGALGVDKEGMIYWNGRPIQIRNKLELRNWEFAIAVIVALGTLMQAIAAFFPFIPTWIAHCLGF